MHWLLELLKEIGVAFGMDVLFDKLKKEGAPVVVDKMKKKITDEHRAEMLTFIRELAARDPLASETLLRRHRDRQEEKEISYLPGKRYLAGSEDTYVTLLTKLHTALSDSDGEKESRFEMFKWLGRMNDQEFDATLEFLNHDVVMQYIRKTAQIAGMAIPEIKRLIEKFEVKESLRKVDSGVGSVLEKLNDNLERRWWIRGGGRTAKTIKTDGKCPWRSLWPKRRGE